LIVLFYIKYKIRFNEVIFNFDRFYNFLMNNERQLKPERLLWFWQHMSKSLKFIKSALTCIITTVLQGNMKRIYI